jgi:hypothetical protein
VRQRGLGNSAGTQTSINAMNVDVLKVSQPVFVWTLDLVPACDGFAIVACGDAGMTVLREQWAAATRLRFD